MSHMPQPPTAPWATDRTAVPGEGPPGAPLMLVGEQPGDAEDRQGRPFVGPAGRLLDRALQAAGLDRAACYLTNAVKHFKFTQRGARRIHQKPDSADIALYRPFLLREVDAVAPKLIVALGATAAQGLLGRKVGVLKLRGQFLSGPDDRPVLLTVHPSFLLRLPDPAMQEEEYQRFVRELVLAKGRVFRS